MSVSEATSDVSVAKNVGKKIHYSKNSITSYGLCVVLPVRLLCSGLSNSSHKDHNEA